MADRGPLKFTGNLENGANYYSADYNCSGFARNGSVTRMPFLMSEHQAPESRRARELQAGMRIISAEVKRTSAACPVKRAWMPCRKTSQSPSCPLTSFPVIKDQELVNDVSWHYRS